MTCKSGFVLSLAIIAAAGCTSSGLSAREGGSRTVSNYVLQMHDVPTFAPSDGAGSQHPVALVFPITVAVSQIGEVSPPAELLTAMRSRPDLFSRVEQIPGPMPTNGRNEYRGSSKSDFENSQEARENIGRIGHVAQGMGVSNLLLIGGTIDQSSGNTAWSAANLTIIGAFITPGRQVVTETRATGVMIDLASNRIAMTAAGQAKNAIAVSAASEGESRNNEMRKSRDAALATLSTDLINQAHARRATSGAPYPR